MMKKLAAAALGFVVCLFVRLITDQVFWAWLSVLVALIVGYLTVCVSAGVIQGAFACTTFAKLRRWKSRNRPPLQALICFADWLPLKTRKAVKALAGDYADEIRVFRRQRRRWVARWNVVLAWGFALWYVLKAPFSAIVSLVKKLLGSSIL